MEPDFPARAATGVGGLDHILRGGVPRDEVYLVQGGPGTGKTTLALQFLRAGAADGERSLFITLSQSAPSLRRIARSHGWTLDGVEVREGGESGADRAQTVFHPSEVQLGETLSEIRETVGEVGPSRLVVDTITDLRVLSSHATQYRRELRALRDFLNAQGITTLFLDDSPDRGGDRELQNQANGVLSLRQQAPEYGEVRRWLQVAKMRSTPFFTGGHNFRIETGGIRVFPRVQANGHNGRDDWEPLESGIAELDAMLGGGLREGTACLVAGPTGSGKSAVAFQHAHAAAERGQTAAVFLFNERLETFYMRARGLGMAMEPHVEAGRLHVRQVNTGSVAPSEFAQQVRGAVEDNGAKVVVIDSLSGYINAMLKRDLLVSQLHELITFLSQRGVLTLLVADQQGPFASGEARPSDVSYLADSVLLLGYRKENGLRRRTISVLKQRHGAHALDARELLLSPDGLSIGGSVEGIAGLTLDPPLLATLYPHDGRTNEHVPTARA